MTRRYARITVDAWVYDYDRVPAKEIVYMHTGPEGDADLVGVVYGNANATVEWLPAPIVFADGDALEYTEGSDLRVFRAGGRWVNREGHKAGDDDWQRSSLRNGLAVRLVPEVTP